MEALAHTFPTLDVCFKCLLVVELELVGQIGFGQISVTPFDFCNFAQSVQHHDCALLSPSSQMLLMAHSKGC